MATARCHKVKIGEHEPAEGRNADALIEAED
jgi:hypothetical protein